MIELFSHHEMGLCPTDLGGTLVLLSGTSAGRTQVSNNSDCGTIECPPPVQSCPVWVLSAALSSCFSCEMLFGDPSSVPLSHFVPHERCSWDELQLPSELMSVPGAAGQWVSVTLWGEGRPSAWGGPPSYCRDQLLSRRGDHPTVYSRLVVSDMLLLCGWDSDSQLCLYHLFTWNWPFTGGQRFRSLCAEKVQQVQVSGFYHTGGFLSGWRCHGEVTNKHVPRIVRVDGLFVL